MNKSKYYKTLYFVKNLRLQIACVTIGYLLVGFFEALATTSYYPVISHLLKIENKTMEKGFFLKFMDYLLSFMPYQDSLVRVCALAIILTALSVILTFVVDGYSLWLKYSLNAKSLEDIYGLMLRQKKLDEKMTNGEMIYMMTTSSSAVGEVFHYLPKTLAEVAKIFFLGLVLIEMSLAATVGAAAIMFFTFILYHFWGTKIIYVLSDKMREVEALSMGHLNQSLSGHSTIRHFNGSEFFKEKYSAIIKRFKFYAFNSQFLNSIPNKLALLLFQTCAFFLIIYLKLKSAQSFETMLPAIATYFITLQKILPSISNLGGNWLGLQGLIPRMEVFYNYYFNTKFDSSELIETPALDVRSIEFKNLTYKIKDKVILSNINLSIKKGDFIAIVGASGSGKSTLAKLLTNAVEPTEGQVLLNERELATYHTNSLNEAFSIVEQSPYLFSLTAKENITMGNETISEQKLFDSAEKAGVFDFIPKTQLDKEIKENGANLSGGQKQKMSIARSIARSPKVLILDEATSAFDAISEQKFKQNLSLLRNDFILIVIAHRLSSIVDADKIYVLEHGEIRESGKHQDLYNSKGIYREMYDSFYEN